VLGRGRRRARLGWRVTGGTALPQPQECASMQAQNYKRNEGMWMDALSQQAGFRAQMLGSSA